VSWRVTTRDDIAAVIALYKANHVLREILAQTGVALRVVQNLVKCFRELGEGKLPAPLPKSGRPKLLSPRALRLFLDKYAREVKERNPRLLSHVSLSCVQQALHDDLGFKSFRARRKPLLTKRQKENRVKFCKKYEVWDLETWRSVLWSDEATFSVTGSNGGRVYRPPHSDAHLPQYTVKTVKHPASLMVWASFTYYGVGELVILPKNQIMNQYNYLELLSDFLPESFDKAKASLFMQDGAPCHTAESVIQWLKDWEVPFFNDWPGTSSIPKLEAAIKDTRANLPPDLTSCKTLLTVFLEG
ncbi:Transposable element Tc1 transposase-like 1, partial [Homarus americanus]